MEERLQKDYRDPLKVLLADDDSDDRDLFEEAVGFVDPQVKVTMAKDGEELIDLLVQGQFRPDLIFLDLNMPRKNGKECLEEMMQDPEFKNIPVIIYTTSLNPVDIDDTFNQGARHFFRKPNSFEELKEILHRIFKSSIAGFVPRSKENFVLNGILKSEYK